MQIITVLFHSSGCNFICSGRGLIAIMEQRTNYNHVAHVTRTQPSGPKNMNQNTFTALEHQKH